MPDIDRQYVEERLAEWIDPLTGEDLVSGKSIKGVGVSGGRISVEVQLGYPAKGLAESYAESIGSHLEADPQIDAAVVNVGWRIHAHKVQGDLTPIKGVKNVIAVASGKGGVGKSTTAVNLALALQADGAAVGILDADIYGPSQPRMMGLSGRPEIRGESIVPKVNYGVQTMSIGYLIDEDQPMIWRGPMVTQALQQLINETEWSDLDYLIVDMPPGTGDIQLTLAQRVPVSGAIIITTPQDISLLDARKGLKMFEKVDVPVLGIVENMSTHICSKCGHEEHIFGTGGGAQMAQEYGVELLGSLPLDIRIREQTDSGKPTVIADAESKIAEDYLAIARKSAARLSTQARNKKLQFPNIVIQNT
ncbi:MAG: iron-sulfur cluster carrier protein ApbC [Xanthomonadales bacterium]|nr:iron-sulfur cluster carrier protein ApbC [Xanthomonadales bacterium]